MSDREHPDVVRLTTAANPAQAHIWQQALEGEGIDARVVGDYLDAGVGDIPGLQAELWVHPDDFERAQAVLDEHMPAEETDEEEEIVP